MNTIGEAMVNDLGRLRVNYNGGNPSLRNLIVSEARRRVSDSYRRIVNLVHRYATDH